MHCDTERDNYSSRAVDVDVQRDELVGRDGVCVWFVRLRIYLSIGTVGSEKIELSVNRKC